MPFAPVRDDDPDLQALIGGDAPAAPAAAARPAANGAVADDDPDLQALLNGPSKSSGPIMPEIGKPVEGGTPELINGATAAAYALSKGLPFAEDFGAAIQAGETYLPTWANIDHAQEPDNATFSQRFANERRKIGQTDKALSLVYPRTMSYGPIASSVAIAPVAGPADALAAGATRLVPGLGGLAADAIGSAAVGAGYGAAYGASDGDTIADRVQNAVHGAGSGLAGGAIAPVVGRALGAVGNGISDKLGLTSADAEAGNLIRRNAPDKPAMSDQDIQNAQNAGQPIAPIDVLGGEKLYGVADTAAIHSPEAAKTLNDLANDRFNTQQDRGTAFMQAETGSTKSAGDFLEEQQTQAKADNKVNYDAAMNHPENQSVWNDGLKAALQHTDVQDAIKGAVKMSQNEAASENVAAYARNPDAPLPNTPLLRNPFITDAEGNLTLPIDPATGNPTVTPSLRFWDYVKRGLDDKQQSALRAGENNQARVTGTARQGLIDNLDTNTAKDPASGESLYAIARSGAKGAFDEQDAFTGGLNYLKRTNALKASQNDLALQKMQQNNPQAAEFFGRGVMTDITHRINDVSTRQQAFKMLDNPNAMAKLYNAVGQPRGARIESFLRTERIMDTLRTKLGNSKTVERQHRAGMPNAHGALGMISKYLSEPISGAITGGFGAYETGNNVAYGALGGAALGAVAMRHAYRQKAVAEAVAKMLTDTANPAISARTMQAMGSSPDWIRALSAVQQRALTLSPAEMKLAGQRQQQLHQNTSYAKGGKVKGQASHEELVQRLIDLAEKAKKTEKNVTKPLLKAPDHAIIKALAVAKQSI